MGKDKKIAVFDFDGTLTRKDSFIEFASHAVGWPRLLLGISVNFHSILAWKLRLMDGGQAKEKLFSWLFKGMPMSDFHRLCKSFVERIYKFERNHLIGRLHDHLHRGDKVIIVSASVPDWIIPWAVNYGIMEDDVIGTEVEVDDNGRLTGKFSTPNCNGPEKVNRLKERVPDLSDYEICVYGNSSGDKSLMEIADHAYKV